LKKGKKMDEDVLLIKNGTVLDPAQGIREKKDVAVKDGKILALGDFSKETTHFMVDASQCYVTPGLIDHHAHVYPLMKTGIPSEALCFSAGVTTVVDAGSTGYATYEAARPFIQSETLLEIRPYLNVCATGLATLPHLENLDPAAMDEDRIKAIFDKFPGEFEGLKIRTSKNIVKDFGFAPLDRTLEIADKIGVPVMVHCTNPPGPLGEVIRRLRPGDVLTHMYQNIGYKLIDDSKEVIQEAYKAREEGVIFEAADARAHFSFEVSEPAIREGFLPDIIATDLTQFSMNQRPTSFNLAMQMSKYVYLGMDFYEVLRRCTENPAKLMHRLNKIGSLKVGTQGDIAIFKEVQCQNEFGDRPYYDADCKVREGNKIFKPMMTIKKGKIVFRDMLF
jgi:dihydroorotase